MRRSLKKRLDLRSAIVAMALVVPACHGAPSEAPGPVASTAPFPACPQCDVVLLNIGLLRPDFVGITNPASEATPSTDRFFASSVIFDRASSPSGATYLSATAIATATEVMFNTHDINMGLGTASDLMWLKGGGRWLVLDMLAREGPQLVDRMPTLAQSLGLAGYDTVAFNDWIHTGRSCLLDRGYREYRDFTDTSLRGAEDRTSMVPLDEQVDAVIEALRSPREAPLLLYYHPNALHFPYPHPDSKGQLVQMGADAALFRRAYESRVAEVDRALSRIYEVLLERPRRDRTLVVLYCNHGISLGEEDRDIGVGVAWQPTVAAVLLLRHPGLDAARHVREPVSLVDLAPTILDLVGVEPLIQTGAPRLTPLFSGEGVYERSYVFGQDLFAEYVRHEDWKMIVGVDGQRRLFQLDADPSEIHDLAAERPAELLELEAALEMERARQVGLAEKLKAELDSRESPPTP